MQISCSGAARNGRGGGGSLEVWRGFRGGGGCVGSLTYIGKSLGLVLGFRVSARLER
jgi:hypothetical protein